MYDRSTFLKLNNYGYSDEDLEDVKNYLTNRELPDKINTNVKAKRYDQKWIQFEIRDDKLFYKKLDLEVVPNNERNEKMKELYENEITGPGRGIEMFYHTICDKYLNIRRSDASEFLKKQKVYQMTRTQHHKMNKPILSKNVNERWGIDCINMTSFANNNGGQQNGYKFILTIVDYFSRFVWARKMKMQTAINVTKALKSIVEETNTYPKIIQADNGSEFMNETSDWMKENNIVYIKTLSYTPTSNGLVEGKNRRIREVLRELMIRNNNRNWTNSLQLACDNLNSQRNGTTKQKPSSIWRQGHDRIDRDKGVVDLHKKRIIKEIKKSTAHKFEVGDLVRVKMGALFSKIRKLIKSDNKKLIVVNYSSDVYTISTILNKDLKDTRDHLRRSVQYENLRYTLKLNGVEVQTERKMNNPDRERKSKRFFASDLIKVDKETKNTFLEDFSMKDAMKLNKQDPIVQNVIVPALPENPALPVVIQNNEKEKEKEKEKVDKLIGREIRKKFQNHGYFIGKVMSFDDPYYKIIYTDGDQEEMTRASVLKYLVDLENTNAKVGLRKKKEVIIGGQIHYIL